MTHEQFLAIILLLVVLILTATLALARLILVQSRATRLEFSEQISTLRSELHSVLQEATQERTAGRNRMDRQIGDIRCHVDGQIGDLRDLLGRIEGYLDIVREFFVSSGRGTGALSSPGSTGSIDTGRRSVVGFRKISQRDSISSTIRPDFASLRESPRSSRPPWGRMEHMSELQQDLHEQLLEALRRRALHPLRSLRSLHGPD